MLEVFFCVKAWLVVDMMKVRILKIKEIFLSFEKVHSQGAECIQAQTMLTIFKLFEFVFIAHLLLIIFGYTDDLNHVLHKRDRGYC
jgi:hypothetical protein